MIDRAGFVICLLGAFGGLAMMSQAQAPSPASPNLSDVAVRLMAQMKATAAECPPDIEDMRPSRMVSCGRVDLGLKRFMSMIDALLADPEITGGAAVRLKDSYASQGVYAMETDGRMVPQEEFHRRSYTLGDASLSVSYYVQTKRMVVYHDVPFPRCQAGESAGLSTPPGLIPPKAIPESKTPPQYPKLARNARVSGLVTVRVIVATDGTPRHACVLGVKGAAGAGLELAALQAIESWRFEPATLEGKAVEAPATIGMSFNLKE